GRMELAEAILAQPLAMRVIVNRVWKAHFGTGIVDSLSNFGVTGERPVHPELLDYLATYFRDHGMSFKQLHREILLSAVYQLSNEFSQAAFDRDAENRYYWRFNRRRMDAEQIRDSLLAASGQLEKKLYGPSEPLSPEYTRRTVYGKVSRYRLDDYLQLFDFPSPNISAEQRFTTNVPLQRLFFMNSDFVQQQAEQLVKKVEDEPVSEGRIRKLRCAGSSRKVPGPSAWSPAGPGARRQGRGSPGRCGIPEAGAAQGVRRAQGGCGGQRERSQGKRREVSASGEEGTRRRRAGDGTQRHDGG